MFIDKINFFILHNQFENSLIKLYNFLTYPVNQLLHN